jgi:hypothetical protein
VGGHCVFPPDGFTSSERAIGFEHDLNASFKGS